jgi:N-methylhydantoinase A/oxoprolinase/acetone carboxylase beta subunit
VHLRYEGTGTPLQVPYGSAKEMPAAFEQAYQTRFSFLTEDKRIVVEAVSVEAAASETPPRGRRRPGWLWQRAAYHRLVATTSAVRARVIPNGIG